MSFLIRRIGISIRDRMSYHGAPVGLNTSGVYQDISTKPAPWYYVLTQGKPDSKSAAFFGLSFLMFSMFCTGPFFMARFNKDGKRDAALKYGPTRYGHGIKDIV